MRPRGIRNCNPGNIRLSNDKWQGLRPQQTDHNFFQFTEMKYGYRALMKTIRTYNKKRGCKTISDYIHRWAPSCENSTIDYIKSVCEYMDVAQDYVLNVEDKNEMCNLAAAISRHENGVTPNMNEIYQGWNLL